jgi:hypothetical protein
MRRSTVIRTLGIVLALGALLGTVAVVAAAPPAQPRNFVAPLSGDEEFPLPIDTQARGVGIFHLSADGTELTYRLVATNIDDVIMAHIHCCAGPGANAGIAVWLYPEAPPAQLIPGRHTGTLATGTITAADLTGPLAGMTIADLVDRIESGVAYVNVHTSANPGGEIRGQLP